LKATARQRPVADQEELDLGLERPASPPTPTGPGRRKRPRNFPMDLGQRAASVKFLIRDRAGPPKTNPRRTHARVPDRRLTGRTVLREDAGHRRDRVFEPNRVSAWPGGAR
jgi:hypothetical protein